ncbi:hypothetical protein MASSI9I_20463 [Massilia sp. 9I]|nr:hypothetical protein MASSI9I_20463 [Massilia sp. 9I]
MSGPSDAKFAREILSTLAVRIRWPVLTA